MSSVTFDVAVGGDGSTVTDDNNATTGLREGGWKTRFVPCFTQQVAIANYIVTKAGEASTSATAASSSAIAAAASYDSFDDRYLGAKSSDPSTDNDGNALLTGAVYWNTSSSVMKVWSGTVWIAYNPAIGYLALSGGTMTGEIVFADNQKFLNWIIKTTTYNPAVAGDNILADTSAGAFTITLPASASLGDIISVVDHKGTFATNNLTINSNSLNLMGSVQTLILNVNYRNVTLVYSGATQGWVIVL